MTKNTNDSLYDATLYQWDAWDASDPFAFLKHRSSAPVVGDVLFDKSSFAKTYRNEHKVDLCIYGTGAISEYAAVLLEDGTIQFCIVYGSVFVSTMSSNENIRMQYFTLTPLVKTEL